MNVVVFGKGFGKPRQVHLSGRKTLAIAAALAGVIGTFMFTAGYIYSAQNGSGLSQADVAVLSDELNFQKDEIAVTRQQTEDTLDALAIRIGQMNARIVRLDALGRRLTEMADLDDGEFDFDAVPAMGGPEEPYADFQSGAVTDVLTAMTQLDTQLYDRESQLGVLENVILNQNLSARVHPQGRPVKAGWLSSHFGRRTDPFTGKPANHQGVDFAGKAGAEIFAVADGVVTWSSERYGFGNLVEINHGNGYATRYAHNSANLVAVGDEVQKGQTVALMGNTGRATGPNLHFEVLKNGQRVNPVNFIKKDAD